MKCNETIAERSLMSLQFIHSSFLIPLYRYTYSLWDWAQDKTLYVKLLSLHQVRRPNAFKNYIYNDPMIDDRMNEIASPGDMISFAKSSSSSWTWSQVWRSFFRYLTISIDVCRRGWVSSRSGYHQSIHLMAISISIHRWFREWAMKS